MEGKQTDLDLILSYLEDGAYCTAENLMRGLIVKAKPSTEPSAEELVDKLRSTNWGAWSLPNNEAAKLIEADRARQREKGREEALAEMAENAMRLKKHYDDALEVLDKRYAALEEAAKYALAEWEYLCTCDACECKQEILRKALEGKEE